MYHYLSLCRRHVDTKRMLFNSFDMKDLRVADVILGIKITRIPDGISLSQSHYVEKMIERFSDHEIKENTNPFLLHIYLHKNTGTKIRQLEYSQIIENLIYLMNCTRLDIAYVVSKLSRYTSNPSDQHWTALLRVLGLSITYQGICLEIWTVSTCT